MSKVLATVKVLTLLILFFITGCATIEEGTTQNILVESIPSTSNCQIFRGGKLISAIEKTPGVVSIKKTSKELSILCKKPGYTQGIAVVESELNRAAIKNITVGGLVGGASGAAGGAYLGSSAGFTGILTAIGGVLGTSVGVFGGLIGLSIDSISGAQNKYSKRVLVALEPEPTH